MRRKINLSLAAIGDEAGPEAYQCTDEAKETDMLHLTGCQRTTPRSGRRITLNFETERTDFDLGGLRPGEVPGEASDDHSDDQ